MSCPFNLPRVCPQTCGKLFSGHKSSDHYDLFLARGLFGLGFAYSLHTGIWGRPQDFTVILAPAHENNPDRVVWVVFYMQSSGSGRQLSQCGQQTVLVFHLKIHFFISILISCVCCCVLGMWLCILLTCRCTNGHIRNQFFHLPFA